MALCQSNLNKTNIMTQMADKYGMYPLHRFWNNAVRGDHTESHHITIETRVNQLEAANDINNVLSLKFSEEHIQYVSAKLISFDQ